jgi:hypothetical protein
MQAGVGDVFHIDPIAKDRLFRQLHSLVHQRGSNQVRQYAGAVLPRTVGAGDTQFRYDPLRLASELTEHETLCRLDHPAK